MTAMRYDARGSLWNRWDLHFHTPSSFDYDDRSVTNKAIIDRLIAENVHVVAITDHHTIDIQRIKDLQQLGGDRITILPGMELRSDQGGKPINYICVFPEDCDLEHVWTTLQGSLGLTPTAIKGAGGDDKVYIPIEQGAKLTRDLGGVVSIHAGGKSNSIEGIQNKTQFQQRIKFDITSKWVDLMEIGQLKDIDRHLQVIFPATGLERPLIICSDNHNIASYSIKAPLWFRADPTFRGLLMVLREPRERVFIGTRPHEMIRVEQNPTKYIRRISFQRRTSAPATEKWFSGSIDLNHGLVAVVGNKGSGKSALSDMFGLLGSTKNSRAFSFLSPSRFRHPTEGYAQHFDAVIEWNSGEKVIRSLADPVRPEEVERIKYLPQDHIENVCNELVALGEEGFERELKTVIFSHVPETQRLGHTALDELVQFQTGEKQKRIDSLIKQLREISRARAALESQTDPVTHRELLEKIRRRELELDAHDKAKPAARQDPAKSVGSSTSDAVLLKELAEAESEKKELFEQGTEVVNILRNEERRLAVANRLIEKLENFKKDYTVFKDALIQDAAELGVKVDELATISVNSLSVETIRDVSSKAIASAQKQLDEPDPPGLRKKYTAVQSKITDIQQRLDGPNREYQTYLKELADWQERRAKIEGAEDDPESLKGLRATLSGLEEIPAKIRAARFEQAELAMKIHAEKAAQADVYRKLYGPVQQFIDSHELAKDKLKLEFRAELTCQDFSDRLLGHLALNRRGSFMGVDEGRTRANDLVETTDWQGSASVSKFLERVDTALREDQREAAPTPIQLKDQLLKGRRADDLFNMLYGLDYVRPRYVLRWEGKDLARLSAGERGTLLLVFYLLIDTGNIPLVMDQPEGNLDNHTVAKVLVDCIKEARKKRQVFIVTHNPNLAVVCDADQIIHASMDKSDGNAITYASGSLENPAISQVVTDVLEGTRWAFRVRDKKYEICEPPER